jgi:hypothetical protein
MIPCSISRGSSEELILSVENQEDSQLLEKAWEFDVGLEDRKETEKFVMGTEVFVNVQRSPTLR